VDVDVDVSRHVTSAGLGVPTLTLTSPVDVDVELDGDGDGDMVDRAACSEPVATQFHCSDFRGSTSTRVWGTSSAMPTKFSR
jgi:hypothetical protein